MNKELIYSDFNSVKISSYLLKPIRGSMVALKQLPDDDIRLSPPTFVPIEETLNQKSILPRITNEDVNTINIPAKLPLLTNVYLGTLTIVGLFILFRFIQKHP
jgi:hypothetical protein